MGQTALAAASCTVRSRRDPITAARLVFCCGATFGHGREATLAGASSGAAGGQSVGAQLLG